MSISTRLDKWHLNARGNLWLYYFAIFNRFALAAGFIPSGMVKILGERFTDLSNNHPMGAYLDALYHTGYYYTFIGVMQVTAAILLLLPWTAIIGAFIYFPIILNIFILTIATRFDGSLLSSPLMVLANLYLICWYYDKWKYILPFNRNAERIKMPEKKDLSRKFPFRFFGGVAIAIFLVVAVLMSVICVKPFNTMKDCMEIQCDDTRHTEACESFCSCIHEDGRPLKKCLKEYKQAIHQSK